MGGGKRKGESPVKTRERGVPDEEMWQGFFDAETVLRKLGLTSACRNVVDFGCGYGTFTIPATRIVSGVVYHGQRRSGSRFSLLA